MDVTIHYNGKLENRARLAELLDAARLYCAEQRWACREVDERIVGQVERVMRANVGVMENDAARAGMDLELEPIDDSLQGLLITPHKKSEPIWLTFNRAGELAYYMPLDDRGTFWEIKALFTRPQSAGIDTHIAVCDFLRFIRDEYMPGLNVYDEANYFESGDANNLGRTLDFSDTGVESDENDSQTEFVRTLMDSTQSEQVTQDAPRRKKIPHQTPKPKRSPKASARKN